MMTFRANTIRFLSQTGLAALARRVLVRDSCFVLMFHGIAERQLPDLPVGIQPVMTCNELWQVLAWLSDRFAFLTPEDFYSARQAGVLITFDDGFASNFNYALPLLIEFNAPAVFFISTQHILDPKDWLPASRRIALQHWPSIDAVPSDVAQSLFDGMTVGQLKKCAANPLITIGGHTRSHPFLTHCTPEKLIAELVDSRRWLQEMTGQPVDLFAYPTGDYDRRVAEVVRQAGYRAAFVEDPIGIGMPAYEIPRIGIYYAEAAYLDVKLSGLHQQPIRRRYG